MAPTQRVLLLLSVFLLASSAAALALSSKEDPELKYCKRRCRQTEHLTEREVRECERRCEEAVRKKEHRREAGDDHVVILSDQDTGPEERLQECRRRCETEHRDDPDQCAQCRRWCQERYEEERRSEPRGRGSEDAVLEQGSPEERLRECQRQCETQHRHDREQCEQCQRRCRERYEEEQKEQHRGRGGRSDGDEDEGPEERLKQCRRQCKSEGYSAGEQSRCERWCQERYEKERRERGGGEAGEPNPGREEEAEEQQEGRRSPFFFDRESFGHRVRTEHGSVRVLERFTKRSELLRALENYRLAFLEANPNAFVLPHHIDADTIYYVANGRGTIKLLRGGESRRESHDVRRGDIITVNAGTVVYIVNTDSNEKLHIAKLMRTVSTPGKVREYFAVGGEDPESFLRSFSDEILEAAFKARKESVEKMFGRRQRKGAIVRASQEQVRAMSHGGSWEGGRQAGESTTRHFNLLSKRPSHSSRHGQLYEATADDCRELGDLDVKVSFANITGGSMTAPYYLTRSTKVILVLEGEGNAEMACPHMDAGQKKGKKWEREGERGQQEKRVRYQKVRSRLSWGSVFIVPAGHPVAIVASGGRNLQALCFEINAKNSQRIFLAGRNSILKQLESEAKELSFDAPAREVDEFLNGQEESEMVSGPEKRQEEKSHNWAGSILEFAGF